ncbi:hypothetical protein BCEP27_30771 [Burkholderia cepacia]
MMHPLSTDWRALSNNLHSLVERDSLRVLVRKRSFVFVFIRFPATESVAPSRRVGYGRHPVRGRRFSAGSVAASAISASSSSSN